MPSDGNTGESAMSSNIVLTRGDKDKDGEGGEDEMNVYDSTAKAISDRKMMT